MDILQFNASPKKRQAEILTRVLLMRACRFDTNSIIQRLSIDCDIQISHHTLTDIEAGLGLRTPAWRRVFQELRAMLRMSAAELSPFECRVQTAPGEAGVLLGLILWERGHRDLPNWLDYKLWPASCQAIHAGVKLSLGLRQAEAINREAVVAYCGGWAIRLRLAGLTPLQLAELAFPGEESTRLSERLLQIKGSKKSWKMPKIKPVRGLQMPRVPAHKAG